MIKVEKIKVGFGNRRGNKKNPAIALIKAQKGNFRRIGSGCFGDVFGSDQSSIVYKTGLVEENQTYLDFIRRVANLKVHNPYFPKVFGIRIYKDIDESDGDYDRFVVAMERLAHLKNLEHRRAVDIIDSLLCKYSGGVSEFESSALGIKVVVPKVLERAASLLQRIQDDNRASFDIHDQNIMLRGNRQLVFTDPFTDD